MVLVRLRHLLENLIETFRKSRSRQGAPDLPWHFWLEDTMHTYQVGYFVGSLSSTSINRLLSKALIGLTPADMEFTELPIGDLPLYSPDLEDDYPPEPRALKQLLAASDAVLFVTPEYNRSIPRPTSPIGPASSPRTVTSPTRRRARS